MFRAMRTLVPLSRQVVAHQLAPRFAPAPSPSLLLRSLSSTAFRFNSTPSAPPPEADAPPKKHAIGRINRRLQITFTCTAAVPVSPESDDAVACSHRSTHEFSKRSYEKGIVLIECPGCKNRHLIGALSSCAPVLFRAGTDDREPGTADNLSWFSSTPSPGFPQGIPIGTEKPFRTVEDLVREKGEEVKWLDGGKEGGTWELEG